LLFSAQKCTLDSEHKNRACIRILLIQLDFNRICHHYDSVQIDKVCVSNLETYCRYITYNGQTPFRENGFSGFFLFFLGNRKRHYFLSGFFVRAVINCCLSGCVFFAFVWSDPEHRATHTRTCTRWGHTIVVFRPLWVWHTTA